WANTRSSPTTGSPKAGESPPAAASGTPAVDSGASSGRARGRPRSASAPEGQRAERRPSGRRSLVFRTRSPLPKSGVDRRRWQGATTRNSWRYSEEEQRRQRRRDAPEFGDGLRVRDTSGEGGPAP